MITWHNKAIKLLENSLSPIPQELNGIDWKCALSDKSERLAHHICAFSNTQGGGFLVFGINNDDASFVEITKIEVEEIANKLGNIAKNNLAWSIQLEHAVVDYKGHALLFIRIPEQTNKPIYLRGKDIYEAYIRSAGHTVKMSREQIHELIAQSHGLAFEDRASMNVNSAEDVLRLLDYGKFFELLHKNVPTDVPRIITQLEEYGLIAAKGDSYEILNLGALLFARELREFNNLRGKEIIVRRYESTNNRVLNIEYVCKSGYAVGFEDLIDFIAKNTSVERIEVMRSHEPSYPIVAVRELLANMMVHQDFAIKGMVSTVEIFTNRITFTNPGSSLNDVNRLIDLPPHSRNEKMAQLMLLLDMCERRGSGIDRATDAIGQMKLPAYKAQSGDDFTRITLFPKKSVKDMTREERIAACYQHACLLYEDGLSINNMSVRERFNLNKNQTVLASRILSDTQQTGLIKPVNPEVEAKRYYAYIPYYG